MGDSPKLTAAEMTEKWQRKTKGGISDFTKGVEKVKRHPGEMAAEKEDKWFAGIQKSRDQGTWKKNVAAGTVEEWKKKTIEKGAQRIGQGVDAAVPKHQKFAAWQVGALKDIMPNISQMPDLTLEDRIAKSAEFQRQMAQRSFKAES